MRTKERIYPVFRRVIYIALFVLTGVVQNTLLGMRGSILLPLIPLTVAVCVFEHEYAGFFFGLLGGALYDLAPRRTGYTPSYLRCSAAPQASLCIICSAARCSARFFSR